MANTTGLGDTIYAAVKKALEDKNGGSGGGGGSSDLSIAQVTITYEHEETGSDGLKLPLVEEANPPFVTEASSFATTIDFTPDIPIQVILYKGKCTATYFGTGTVNTSGNVTYQNHEFLITGDGSITIS